MRVPITISFEVSPEQIDHILIEGAKSEGWLRGWEDHKAQTKGQWVGPFLFGAVVGSMLFLIVGTIVGLF